VPDPRTPDDPTHISVVELERIAALGWRGTSERWLGDWLLRAGGGFTGRANSTLVLGPPGRATDDALAEVSDYYAHFGLPVRFSVPDGVAGADRLAAALHDRGFRDSPPVLVMVAPLSTVLAACPPRPGVPTATLAGAPSPAWLLGYRYRGGDVPASGVAVLTNSEHAVFAEIAADDEQWAVGRGVVERGWLGVAAVTVAEQRRRAGVGSALLGDLARWAAGRNVHAVYLQVDAANEPAVGLYQRRGFATHHRYVYWA
jgi:N-acetylglutamate synthase